MRNDAYPPVRPAYGNPLLRVLASFPIAGFCGALATDLAYGATENIMWADFSDWLLAVAMAFGVVAALVAGIEAATGRLPAGGASLWVAVLGTVLVLGLGLVNNLVHSRDAWTSVIPQGLLLSALTVVVMLSTIWLSAGMAARAPVRVRAVQVRS